MRYKFLVVVAIFVMILGVMGIITQGKDETKESRPSATAPVKAREVYFTATRDLYVGEFITSTDLRDRVVEYPVDNKPAWLKNSLSKNDVKKILNEDSTIIRDVSKEEVIEKDDIGKIVDKIRSEYVIMPISVLASSISNPSLRDRGFIDLYLISNDNQTYRNNYFEDKDQLGKEYKDTRVKLFAENVYYIRDYEEAKKDELHENDQASDADIKSKNSNHADNISNNGVKVVYAFFRKQDLELVIQAQILGMFFVSPKKVNNMESGISKIRKASREITPSDVVSGAPSSGGRDRVVEIRGAQ